MMKCDNERMLESKQTRLIKYVGEIRGSRKNRYKRNIDSALVISCTLMSIFLRSFRP